MNIDKSREAVRLSWTYQAFMFVCLLGVSLFPLSHVDWALAAGEGVGTANNAIGGFTVVRTDGIQEQLEGKGALPLFEGDVLRTDGSSQAMIEFNDGIKVALNENTMFTILSRWEKGKGFTRVLRLKHGEVWVDTQGGPKPLEIETPVATAAVKGTEFDLLVDPNGQSTLTVMKGVVEFGTAFGTCPIRTSTISYGNRGKKCTKPKPTNVSPNIAWTQAIRQ